jgi:hypothetical protein
VRVEQKRKAALFVGAAFLNIEAFRSGMSGREETEAFQKVVGSTEERVLFRRAVSKKR